MVNSVYDSFTITKILQTLFPLIVSLVILFEVILLLTLTLDFLVIPNFSFTKDLSFMSYMFPRHHRISYHKSSLSFFWTDTPTSRVSFRLTSSRLSPPSLLLFPSLKQDVKSSSKWLRWYEFAQWNDWILILLRVYQGNSYESQNFRCTIRSVIERHSD